MDSFNTISDTSIIAVNRGKNSNVENNIVYRDKSGKLHSVDFQFCVENFLTENNNSSDNCIGERKADENYFIFYTSGIKTKVVFKRLYVSNLFHYHLLSGLRASRFQQLRRYISETKYTTYDLS